MKSRLVNVLMRILAVFGASGLSVIGASSIFGVSTLVGMLIAGTLGVATVTEALARGFLDDGKLTDKEIDSAFKKIDKKRITE
jgi:hypothetical protein